MLRMHIRKRFSLWLFAAALAIRLLFSFAMGDFKNPEMYEHGMIARNMIEGRGFTMHWPYQPINAEKLAQYMLAPDYEGAFIPPANPYMIYYVLKAFGESGFSYFLLMFLNSLAGAFTPLLAYLIAKEFGSERTARIAGLIALAFLPAVFSVITFSGSAQYQSLALLVIYLSIKAYKNKSYLIYCALGLTSGFLCLYRAEFLYLGIVVIAMTAFLGRKSFKRKSAVFAVSLIAFAAVSSPWIIRNTMLYGQFTGIVTHPWHEIWRGNNYLSNGSALSNTGGKNWVNEVEHVRLTNRLDSIPYNRFHEIKVDEVLKDEVLAYAKENPAHVINLAAKRVLYLWTIDILTPRAKDPKYAFFIVITLIMFVTGYFSSFKYSRKSGQWFNIMILSSFICFYTLLIAATNLETRYQVYLYCFFLPLTGIGTEKIMGIFRKKEILEPQNKSETFSY